MEVPQRLKCSYFMHYYNVTTFMNQCYKFQAHVQRKLPVRFNQQILHQTYQGKMISLHIQLFYFCLGYFWILFTFETKQNIILFYTI